MTLSSVAFRRETGLARRWPLVVHARELTVQALTGQVGTLTRAATAATSDLNGVSRTLSRHQPRWEIFHSKACLRLGAAGGALTEYVTWDCDFVEPVPICGLVDFAEAGTVATGDAGSGAGLFAITNVGATGARLTLYANASGRYQLDYYNGTSTVSSTMGTAPTTGQDVRLRWALTRVTTTALVQLWQSIDGGAETTPGVSSAITAVDFGPSPKYWINAASTLLDYGSTLLNGMVVGLGSQSQAHLLEALA